MKKLLGSLALATVGGSLAFGAAASLNVQSDDLGSGYTEVASCQEDLSEVAVSFALRDGNPAVLRSIEFSDLEARCEGQTLSWALQNDETGTLESGEGIVTDGSLSVEFPGRRGIAVNIPAAEVDGVAVTVAGTAAEAATTDVINFEAD